MAKSMDMTRGRPARLIVTFALPLMLGTIFQQLYSLVDSAVVGRLLGVDAFAAVGAASFFGWLSFSVVLGLSQGFGVLFAQRFGAKTGLKRAVSMALLLTLALGAALTVLFQLAVHPVLLLVRTPDALLSGALAYLRWTLGGLVVTFLYNAAASLLRAVGDGRTPLVAVILSSVLNIGVGPAISRGPAFGHQLRGAGDGACAVLCLRLLSMEAARLSRPAAFPRGFQA